MLLLSELQEVVFYAHYDKDPDQGNPRAGWSLVLTIRDLGGLTIDQETRARMLMRLLAPAF